ncbi:GDSL-type esterase/lipase family protein [Streptomyces monomycini]|uniref:GDSL-type esterase/lipase family protein n=1 Tax=Streptomyces monomycini TaxID=371720 RepID=UPI00067E34CC|nr:GDSL-type esterase/lipase family protein [Streptomyces monomycini]
MLAASRAGSAPVAVNREKAIISLGDSFISGEAGRWQGNVDKKYEETKDIFGTDRAAYACDAEGKNCKKDPERVYGGSYKNPSAKKGDADEFAGCHRSDVAEIRSARWPSADGRATALNIACSGALAWHITKVYTRREKAQKDQLIDKRAKYSIKMIHVSIGGNDLQFSDVIKDCAARFLTPTRTPCKGKWEKPIAEALSTHPEKGYMRPRVSEALQAIINAMGKEGLNKSYRIVLQSYPAPIPDPQDFRYPQGQRLTSARWSPGGCPFFDVEAAWARQGVVHGLSQMLEEVANQNQVDFLDLQNAFEHHTLCRNDTKQAERGNTLAKPLPGAQAEWIRFVTQTITKTMQGQLEESVHPNAYGQQALGTCLTKFYEAKRRNPSQQRYACTDRPGGGVKDMTLVPKP